MPTDSNSTTSTDALRHNLTQHRIAIAVALCWIAYLVYLLTAEVTPVLGEWANPPHLTSSVLLAVALSAVLSRFFADNTSLGWWTLVISTLFIIAFECLQLLTPGRSFQFVDIAQGISGAAIAVMIASLVATAVGRTAYVWLSLIIAVIVLISSLALLRVEEPETEVSCTEPATLFTNWNLVRLHIQNTDSSDTKTLPTSIGALCVFDNTIDHTAATVHQSSGTSNAAEPVLQLNGAGLVSGNLIGLRQALAKSGQLTFGVRFRATDFEAGRPPRMLASLQTQQGPSSYVARLIQNGPNTSASFSFQPWQGSSTVMANRLQNQYHEVVLTYDGAVQSTYFDGQLVGTETTSINAIDATGSPLVINIGKRTDRRWKPFIGEIEAIIIGATNLSASEVSKVFTQ